MKNQSESLKAGHRPQRSWWKLSVVAIASVFVLMVASSWIGFVSKSLDFMKSLGTRAKVQATISTEPAQPVAVQNNQIDAHPLKSSRESTKAAIVALHKSNEELTILKDRLVAMAQERESYNQELSKIQKLKQKIQRTQPNAGEDAYEKLNEQELAILSKKHELAEQLPNLIHLPSKSN